MMNSVYFAFILIFFSSQTTPSYRRLIDDIGNPLVEGGKCGRKGMSPHVCDPDGLMTIEQANQLEGRISSIAENTACRCKPQECSKNQAGFVVGIAVIRKMKLGFETQRLIYEGKDDSYIEALLKEAKYFASALLDTWQMGRCEEDMLVFYSLEDNVLYTATNKKAREILLDDRVRDISCEAAYKFEQKGTLLDGFMYMLTEFRSVLCGNAPTTSPARLEGGYQTEDEEYYAPRYHDDEAQDEEEFQD